VGWAQWRFAALFIGRVVVRDDEGVIELTDEPALAALQAVTGGFDARERTPTGCRWYPRRDSNP
jgi:hypothetical protein